MNRGASGKSFSHIAPFSKVKAIEPSCASSRDAAETTAQITWHYTTRTKPVRCRHRAVSSRWDVRAISRFLFPCFGFGRCAGDKAQASDSGGEASPPMATATASSAPRPEKHRSSAEEGSVRQVRAPCRRSQCATQQKARPSPAAARALSRLWSFFSLLSFRRCPLSLSLSSARP